MRRIEDQSFLLLLLATTLAFAWASSHSTAPFFGR